MCKINDVKSLSIIKSNFPAIKPQLFKLVNKALDSSENLIVAGDSDREEASNMIRDMKAVHKFLEQKRTDLKKPHLEAGREIDAWFKEFTSTLEKGDKTLRRKILDYEKVLEQKRQEEEEKIRILEEEKQRQEFENRFAADDEKVDADLQEEIEKTESNIAELSEDNQKTQHYERSTATTIKRWTFKLADFSKVPDTYKNLNEIEIRKAIKNGVRDIPGIDISQEKSLSIR